MTKAKKNFAEGVNLFLEAASAKLPIECVVVREDKVDDFFPLVSKALDDEFYSNTKIYTFSSGCFEKISTEKSTQGLIVIIKSLDFFKSCTKIIEEAFYKEEAKKYEQELNKITKLQDSLIVLNKIFQ